VSIMRVCRVFALASSSYDSNRPSLLQIPVLTHPTGSTAIGRPHLDHRTPNLRNWLRKFWKVCAHFPNKFHPGDVSVFWHRSLGGGAGQHASPADHVLVSRQATFRNSGTTRTKDGLPPEYLPETWRKLGCGAWITMNTDRAALSSRARVTMRLHGVTAESRAWQSDQSRRPLCAADSGCDFVFWVDRVLPDEWEVDVPVAASQKGLMNLPV